jgi:hypothetical protein
MRKTLLLTVILFHHLFANALSIMPNAVQGSLLCGEKVFRVTTIPLELQQFTWIDKKIEINVAQKTTTISWYFSSSKPRSAVSSDTTILNDYLPQHYVNELNNSNQTWSIGELFYLNGNLLKENLNLTAFPFSPCFEMEFACNKVKVRRKRVTEICPALGISTKKVTVQKGDTLNFVFVDSLFNQGAVCLAVGWRMAKDSIELANLPSGRYKVVANANQIVCTIKPCLDLTSQQKYLGIADLVNCPLKGSKGEIFGSLLCAEKIGFVHTFPDSLAKLKYQGAIVRVDSALRRIYVSYQFSTTEKGTVKKDTAILNDYLPRKPLLNENLNARNWSINVIYNVGAVALGIVPIYFVDLYRSCFTLYYSCDQIKVKRTNFVGACQFFDSEQKFAVSGDTLTASFADTVRKESAICARGFIIHTDSVTLTNPAKIDWVVRFKELKRTIVTCVTAPCFPWETTYAGSLGHAYLSNCFPTEVEREESNTANRLLFPNPAHDVIYLKEAKTNVTLTDKLGRETVLKGAGQYTLEGVLPGVYVVSYTMDGTVKRQKLVVE